MRLHVLSDLHLEFAKFVPQQVDADVIVLAGDIGSGTKGVEWARKAFPNKPVVYVPGNHEFYGGDRVATLTQIREAGKQYNILVLDKDEYVMGATRLLGCTLWTDFELFGENKKQEAMFEGQFALNDFRAIKECAGRFTPPRSIELFDESVAWLKSKLDEPYNGKTVVVTHHLPSPQSVVDRFKKNLVSACFASDLDYLFGKMDLWVHGHTHDCLDYVANGTRVVCNPRGYITMGGAENFHFDPKLIVEI